MAVINTGMGKAAVVLGRSYFLDKSLVSSLTFQLCLGYCIGRVQCVFSLPPAAVKDWFPDERSAPEPYLAYIEWFTPFSQAIFDQNSWLY
jgi:hypothetical protein